ncbi:MAG: DMT family transporter [Lachnospiraceae bacterium]|nr:DMT family transporter [Lachnospiraceae bacterium]
MKNKRIRAIIYALLAALFYAVNVPCAKLLLVDSTPTFTASFLYLGAGIGVGIMYLFTFRKEKPSERLEKKDIPYTVAMVILDIAAPILLMAGISMGSAANASLLGNFEIVATSVIALLFFKEKISWRLWIAIALVTCASIILSFSGSDSLRFSLGSILVIGATTCWGIENNCTRSISNKSTYQIVTIKGLCSGSVSFVIALIMKERLPGVRTFFLILLLGFIAYGLSIFTYVRAQNTLGAAKTSAYYAAAPFIGALLSFVFLKEKMTIAFVIALLIMLVGTSVIVYETLVYNHTHVHKHFVTHTHDGTTHTHVVKHSHEHMHVLDDDKHGHTHSIEELEGCLNHRAK